MRATNQVVYRPYGDARDHDGAADHVGAALLAFGALGIWPPHQSDKDGKKHQKNAGWKNNSPKVWSVPGDPRPKDRTAAERQQDVQKSDGNNLNILRDRHWRARGPFLAPRSMPDHGQFDYVEHGVVVVRGAGTGPERLQKFTFKAAGEKLSPLFDGTEQVISLTSVPWYQREIYLPGS